MKLFFIGLEALITSSLLLWLVKHPGPALGLSGATVTGTIGAVHALEGQ